MGSLEEYHDRNAALEGSSGCCVLSFLSEIGRDDEVAPVEAEVDTDRDSVMSFSSDESVESAAIATKVVIAESGFVVVGARVSVVQCSHRALDCA